MFYLIKIDYYDKNLGEQWHSYAGCKGWIRKKYNADALVSHKDIGIILKRMSSKVNTKIQPLIEDVGRIVPGTFLKSTEYKRWLVERNLDKVWAQIYSKVESNRNYFAMGYDHEAGDSKDALNYLLNIIYEQNKDRLPDFLVDLLSFYAYQETAYIDVIDIKKVLLAAGYSKEEIAVLDAITIPEQIEEKIEEELTQEQKVRALEKEYLSFRDENSLEAIDA